MPFVYLGLTRDAGTSKKTGNAYDIAVVHFAVDATQSTRADRKLHPHFTAHSCGGRTSVGLLARTRTARLSGLSLLDS